MSTAPGNAVLRRPAVPDGAAMWRIARDSGVLDTNAPYYYLLWCRDFAGTSLVGTVDERVVAFVTGYLRPDAPETLFVWQVAVDRDQRRRGWGRWMLEELFTDVSRHCGATHLEATVTPANEPSRRLFETFAAARRAVLRRRTLFTGGDLAPARPHEDEVLLRIGPVAAGYHPASSGDDPKGSGVSSTIARNT